MVGIVWKGINNENIIELFYKDTVFSLLEHCCVSGPFLKEVAKTLAVVLIGLRRIQATEQFPLLHTEICNKFINDSSAWKTQLGRI